MCPNKDGKMNELTPDDHRILVDAIHDSATVIHKGQRMNEYLWKITVGDTYVGVANTENRFELLKNAVDNGIIPPGYYITDVKMEMIKNEPTN